MADEITYPENLAYTSDHEWVAVEGTIATVGITGYAQDALGDIVFVQLPEVDSQISAGTECGEVESTKSVSELFAPVTGTVVEVNVALDDSPELVNSDPYGEGWMFKVELSDPSEIDGLMNAHEYQSDL